MEFHTFGKESNKVIVMIHGMLTPQQIWEDAIEYFSKEYYVIVPELDGHTEKEVSEFISVEKEAEQIRQYLLTQVGGKIYALCGLSMGGRIAALLAGMEDILIEHLVLDGAPLQKMPGVLISIMSNNYISIIRKTKKRDAKVIENCKKYFLPERYLDHYFEVADHMEEQSIKNVVRSVFDKYEFHRFKNVKKILFLHGTRVNESASAKSASKLKMKNPQTKIKVCDGYAHAQLFCYENRKWIEEVSEFING